MNTDQTELGPIDYALFEFPGSAFNGAIAPNIIDLVSRGLITILDLVFVKKDNDGELTALEINDMSADELGDIALFEGALDELLSADDIEAAGEVLDPGSSALFIVWENTWAAPLATAIRDSGGVLAATGRIPVQDVLAMIDDAN